MAQPPQNNQQPTLRQPSRWWGLVNKWTIWSVVVVVLVIEPRILGFVLDRLAQSIGIALGNSADEIITLAVLFIGGFFLYKSYMKKPPPAKGRRKRH